MNYIIFDLEFNSGKMRGSDKSINEIIEIGAVKLDESLCEIGSFSRTVKPTLTTHLNKYVKTLTSITEQELKSSPAFGEAAQEFADWCGEGIFASWSNTDLFVLVENYSALMNAATIPYIKRYFDMQKFVTRDLHKNDNNQISLKSAAEALGLDTESFRFHHACDDSRVCAELFRRTFDKSVLKGYIENSSSDEYFKRMAYKPYYITDPKDELIGRRTFSAKCPHCRVKMERISAPAPRFNAINTRLRCRKCKRKFILEVRVKKLYKGVDIKKRLKELTDGEKETAGAKS